MCKSCDRGFSRSFSRQSQGCCDRYGWLRVHYAREQAPSPSVTHVASTYVGRIIEAGTDDDGLEYQDIQTFDPEFMLADSKGIWRARGSMRAKANVGDVVDITFHADGLVGCWKATPTPPPAHGKVTA